MTAEGRGTAPRRGPYRQLIVRTAVAAVLVVAVVPFAIAPVPESCFEYCTVGRSLAAWAIALVALAWLLSVLVVARAWRDRDTRVAAIAAIAGAAFQLIAAMWIFRVASIPSETRILLATAWTLGLGLVLPALWVLSRRSGGKLGIGRIATGISAVAVLVAAVSTILGGASVESAGTVVLFSWLAIQLCTLVLAVVAWRDATVTRPAAALLAVACLPAGLFPIGIIAPGPIGYVIFGSLPVTAAAWLLVGLAWLRTDRD